MKTNHLSIMTLEEYEPNPEFIGRNFNAGEIIQLVLRAPHSGNWLSFRSVQMVMMHELAHCQQMNHGREFWKVNGNFKAQLKELWATNFTGEGLWGRGQTLLSGQYDTGRSLENEIMPANLCGGTFRSRRRKRRRGGTAAVGNCREETYAEAKQRRIAKKFGTNGVALGGDDKARVKLEYGQKVKGKPRIANSARGRELRVAAAAARFGQQKEEVEEVEKGEDNEVKEEQSVDDRNETEDDDYEELDGGETAIDINGSQMLDGKGQDMVRVCADENFDDIFVKEEMDELQELNGFRIEISPKEKPQTETNANSFQTQGIISSDNNSITLNEQSASTKTLASRPSASISTTTFAHSPKLDAPQDSNLICPICSMLNEPSSLLCIACSHVLDTSKVTRYWRCQSEACKDSHYINTADGGICGVCQARKPFALQGD